MNHECFFFFFWGGGARDREKVVRLWFSILLLPWLLSLIFSGALFCVYSIDLWFRLQTRALHQSYELRSFPSMPCTSLPSVRDPSPSACSRRRRLRDRTAKSQHASGGVEHNIRTTDLHHPAVLKSRHDREYHWTSPKSIDKIYAWQHLHVIFTFAFQKRMK